MTRPADEHHGVLVLSCQDAPGIVHAVSGLLVDQQCTIVESHQFDSPVSGTLPTFSKRPSVSHPDRSRAMNAFVSCGVHQTCASGLPRSWRLSMYV